MHGQLTRRTVTRQRRAFRVRKALHGTAIRPRLCVSKTNKHLYAQLIDDDTQITLASVGTMEKGLRTTAFNKKSKEAARELGAMIAKLAKDKKIEYAVFDRGRFKYHGIMAELAQAARDSGLQF